MLGISPVLLACDDLQGLSWLNKALDICVPSLCCRKFRDMVFGGVSGFEIRSN